MQHDYVITGEILGKYILKNPNISKRQFFLWIFQLLEQLQNLERDESKSYCISPFHILLKDDKCTALLDFKMSERPISYSVLKEFFSEEENVFYSFGRTVQFLLAKTNLSPKLTWSEEITLRKIISKCLTKNSKKRYQSFTDIASDFPTHKKNKIKTWLIGGLTGIVCFFACQNLTGYLNQDMLQKEQEMCWNAGISYFLVFEDYDKSQMMFDKVEDMWLAPCFSMMSSFMQDESGYTSQEMEYVLREIGIMRMEELGTMERMCFVRTYAKIDTSYARKQVIELSERLLRESIWEEGQNELREIRIEVFQKEGDYDRALKEYETYDGGGGEDEE